MDKMKLLKEKLNKNSNNTIDEQNDLEEKNIKLQLPGHFIFLPEDDITINELVRILILMKITITEDIQQQLPPKCQRHFKPL